MAKEQIPLNFEGVPPEEKRPYESEEEKLAKIEEGMKKDGTPAVELGDSEIWSIRDKNKKKQHGPKR